MEVCAGADAMDKELANRANHDFPGFWPQMSTVNLAHLRKMTWMI